MNMSSKKMSEEELEKRLHEISIELVENAKKNYKKSNLVCLGIDEKTQADEENTEDTMYVSSELYSEYYSILYELQYTLKEPEKEFITIEYKRRKKEYQIFYSGDGFDFYDYRQVGSMIVDKVTEEELQNKKQDSARTEKEELLKNLMEADKKIEDFLSIEDGKNR